MSISNRTNSAINLIYDAIKNCSNLTNPANSLDDFNIYHQCKLNIFMQNDYEFLVYLDDIEQHLFKMNMISRLTAGIPGIVLTLLVISIIIRAEELRTQFGIICIAIAFCDMMLFVYMVLIELAYDIRFMIIQNPYVVSNADINAPFNILGIRIDRITYYLGTCMVTTCVLLETFKSFQRFASLLMPLFYKRFMTKRKIVVLCVVVIILVHVGFFPILIVSKIDIRYVYGRYLFGPANNWALYPTSILVKYVGDYVYYGNIIMSILLDLGTGIRLYFWNRKRNSEWSKQRATLEKLFLLQNFSNVFTCIILLISYFIFVHVCAGGGMYCMDTFFKRFLRMLYNYDSSKIMWRFLDEAITFLFQFRAFRIYKRNTTITAIKKQSPINNIHI